MRLREAQREPAGTAKVPSQVSFSGASPGRGLVVRDGVDPSTSGFQTSAQIPSDGCDQGLCVQYRPQIQLPVERVRNTSFTPGRHPAAQGLRIGPVAPSLRKMRSRLSDKGLRRALRGLRSGCGGELPEVP